MIENKEIARAINALMIEYTEKLNGSIAMVMKRCSEEEFKLYRKSIGKIMGYMFWEVMRPLYEKHPELQPEWWGKIRCPEGDK